MDTVTTTNYVGYAEVIVNALINQTLDYGIPRELADSIKEGSCVNVPLRNKKKAGIVVSLKPTSQCLSKILPITETIENNIVLTSDLIELALWISRYYFAPLGQILKLFLPGSVREPGNCRPQETIQLIKDKQEILTLIASNKPKVGSQEKILTVLLENDKPCLSSTEVLKRSGTVKTSLVALEKKNFIRITKTNHPDPCNCRPQETIQLIKDKQEILTLIASNKPKVGSQEKILTVLLENDKPCLSSTEVLKRSGTVKTSLVALERKNFIRITETNHPDPFFQNLEFLPICPKELNPEQIHSLAKIRASLENNIFETHLVFGVTGSGKTEIYLQAIEHAKKLHKSTIILVPEIALTVHMVEQFKARFGTSIGVLHHKLSDEDKNKTWCNALKGKLDIIMGPRSALFCPMQNLGLIIVDEEHDMAYKQQEMTPCYHARDTAVMRGKIMGATVVLGSATPSLETFMNAKTGKYHLSVLNRQAETQDSSIVSLIDMKQELPKNPSSALLSSTVLNGIQERIEKGEQSIIFCNRRGYYTQVSCRECDTVLKCEHCDITLTFHKITNELTCHLCGYLLTPPPKFCGTCKGEVKLSYTGVGTEKVERALHAIFPNIRTIRIDSDTIRQRNSYDETFKRFATGKADVLIGTQMIAKGLHFPSVTLSVILNGDSGLHIPDFRASEYVFQVITQVGGRAGRSSLPGEVLIQTFSPANKTMALASERNYLKFYNEELENRRCFNFPPFFRLIKFVFMGKDAELTRREAEKTRRSVALACRGEETIVHPTIPCGHIKIKDLFRYQFLIKTRNIMTTNRAIQNAMIECKPCTKIKFFIDVDPITTFV
ncbi:MAG: primosomal protein N' [Victivallaceae bacterium]